MKIPASAFTFTDWARVSRVEYPGETGTAFWQTVTAGDLRIRLIEFSPGYKADHWCDRGHVVFVLEGEVVTELKDGRVFKTPAGTGFHVSDSGDSAHRSSTRTGAKVFIVD
jgi:hypothetical protein